ncbi:MAG TPA: nuclear transport factor 2 family protein [bacterium]|nr:nuclear transport factor 2 family protein [bacterium]HMW35311.1 nuclear transport factor 2 family protein [bacterium]HMY36464.1 nuclear transport factor 2 family protein [bacterium]HMZ04752.1 nuclear transport factor 2 family protein [bacterium]HNB08347.1 nuclear transport factor 2 family protein [bacterium]
MRPGFFILVFFFLISSTYGVHSKTNYLSKSESINMNLTDEETDRKILSALNAQFIKNYITNDTTSHSKLIHKDFVCIEGDGTILNREEYLKGWAHGYDPNIFISFTYQDELIRIFGNVALVRSKNVYSRMIQGKVVNGSTIYTDTYYKENGQWHCIQAQITAIKQTSK